jgi:hypothetical protein
LPAKATTLTNLSNALKTLIGLERQAFSLDSALADEPDRAPPTDEQRARAFAAFLARTGAKTHE